ncbi:unnamed protein product [Prunus armeniaca]|uniref:Uncharacterized protein n=1 Tax=Prunus armeniaca TaxID=36596 RepID=A0A6J5THK6_PRUAR|nr:unnamed protein product [Prunus armeniaca]
MLLYSGYLHVLQRKCGDPKVLALPSYLVYLRSSVIPKLTGEWKHLEEILSQSSFDKDEAIAVVNFLPKIKKLILTNAEIGRDDVIKLPQGCQ